MCQGPGPDIDLQGLRWEWYNESTDEWVPYSSDICVGLNTNPANGNYQFSKRGFSQRYEIDAVQLLQTNLDSGKTRRVRQMEAGPSLSEDDKWNCQQCTFQNSMTMTTCQICGFSEDRIQTLGMDADLSASPEVPLDVSALVARPTRC